MVAHCNTNENCYTASQQQEQKDATPPSLRNFKRVLVSQLALLAVAVYLLGNDWMKVKEPPKAKTTGKEPRKFNLNKRPSIMERNSNLRDAFRSPPKNKRPLSNSTLFVQPGDYVYHQGWDEAPIVLESHKLVFFTIPKVGCTVFKQLCRRIMGYKDWNVHSHELPHHPGKNGLKYLSDYTLEEASEIMTSPNWTRAIFVRNPQDRVLSAFLDKALHENGIYIKNHCKRTNIKTLEAFSDIIMRCKDPHWMPQWRRMEEKYWPRINFVGNFDLVHNDTMRLLQKVGAWEDYGSSGWGLRGTESIFGSTKSKHATGADLMHAQYYTPELEKKVREIYAVEYNNGVYSHFFVDDPVVGIRTSNTTRKA